MKGPEMSRQVPWIVAVAVLASCQVAPIAGTVDQTRPPAQALGRPSTEAKPRLKVLAVPSNDDRTAATVIQAVPFTDQVDIGEATSTPEDAAGCFGTASHTVWYQYTPSTDIRLQADTDGSNFDPALVLYGPEAILNCVLFPATMRFDAVAGTTYLFMVDDFVSPNATNVSRFNLTQAPPPLTLAVELTSASADRASGVVTVIGRASTNQLGTSASVSLSLTQRQGRALVSASGSTGVDLGTSTDAEWSITLVPPTGAFLGGMADVTGSAAANNTWEGAFAEIASKVQIKRVPR